MATGATGWIRRSRSNELLPPNMSEARLVLLGGSWLEKCSVGNLILGNTGFNSREESSISITVQRKIQEKNLVVINTPDLFYSRTPEAKLKEQVEHCLRLCSSGPHLFLLVVQPENFTEETKKRFYKVLELFSDQSFDSALVLISTSRQRNPSFNQPLQDLITRCRSNSLILRENGRNELLGTIGGFLEKRNEKQQIQHHPVMKHQRQAAPASGAGQHLRVMLFGTTLSTKTQLCNFIIGKKSFGISTSSLQAKPVEWGKWDGNDIIIVTTPESQKGKVLKEELRSCVNLCPPGPNVLLLLVKPSDFTEKDRQTLKATLSLFGEDAFKHSMVVITQEENETSFSFNSLIRECEGRQYKMTENNHQKLMMKIEDIVKRNKGAFLTIKDDKAASKRDETLPPLNLVLFGPSEPLKTAAAKVILGHKDLPSECVRKQGEVFGRGVSLVQLPALDGKAQQEVMEESFRCVSLCDPEGVHAFILVLPVGPLTDEDKGELHTIQDTFSSRVNDFTIILFTTETDAADKDVGDFIKENRDIQDLLQIFGGRYFVLDIRDRQQIKDLMETVEQNVSDREKGSSYTTKTLLWGQMEEKLQLQNKLKKFESKTEAPDPQQIPAADCLRIVLIGKTGGGKSSSGNTILGRKRFEAKASQQSVTRNCQKGQTEIAGRRVVVVDTPGLFDNTLTRDQVDEELLKCISLLAPGPHVFLLVLQVGRFTEEEKRTLRQMKKVFGKNSEDFTLILFTGGDKLQYEDKTIEDYIREGRDESFMKLVRDCGERYHVFNNYDKENRSQANELIQKINNMVKKNEGKCFSSEMLQEAEAAIQREVKRILKEKEEEMEREREELQKKHQEEKESLRRKMEEQREEMEKEMKQRDEQFKEMEENNRKEREQKQREQREREEEEKKRKEEEERQQRQWEKERQDLEKKIKQESEEKETIDRKLEEMRKQMEEKRDAWEKERKEWWEKRHREDEERREELKRFQEKYEKEREKYENQRREDEKRRREQEKERKELEEKYQNQLEEVKRKFEDEARKQAEEFNEFKEKYKKDFSALQQKHEERKEEKQQKEMREKLKE